MNQNLLAECSTQKDVDANPVVSTKVLGKEAQMKVGMGSQVPEMHQKVSSDLGKEQRSLNSVLADCQLNKASHWIKIGSPVNKMCSDNVESIAENHLSKILPHHLSKPQLVSSVNSKNDEKVDVKEVQQNELERKTPSQCDAKSHKNYGNALLQSSKTAGVNSFVESLGTNPLFVIQDSECIDLTDDTENDGLLVQGKADNLIPMDMQLKIDAGNDSKVAKQKIQDIVYVDLTDDQDSSECSSSKLGIESFTERYKETLTEPEKGDNDMLGNELTAMEVCRVDTYKQNEHNYNMKIESPGYNGNIKPQEYKNKYDKYEDGSWTVGDVEKLKKPIVIYGEQKLIDETKKHGHICDPNYNDDFGQNPKISPETVWRRELLVTDFNVMYGNLRAVLMGNLSKRDRHRLIQTMIATMGEIEEVTMGEGNPVQHSVRCETPILDMDCKEEGKDKEETGASCDEKIKEECVPHMQHSDELEMINDYSDKEKLSNLEKVTKLAKKQSGEILTCKACCKEVDTNFRYCRSCYSFKWKTEKNFQVGIPLPTCHHSNYEGVPKCKSCRIRKYCSISMNATRLPKKKKGYRECPVCRIPSLSFQGWKCSNCHMFFMRLSRNNPYTMPACNHSEYFSSTCAGCIRYNLQNEWANYEFYRPFPFPLVEKHSIK